jgi:uncharacterized protein with GYD domain
LGLIARRARVASGTVTEFRRNLWAPEAGVFQIQVEQPVTKGRAMPHFMFQGNYTHAALQKMLAKPEDRSVPAGKLAKSLGGKLREFYLSFGEFDVVAIAELPDEEAAATFSLTVSGAGHITNLRTTRLLTASEAMKAMGRAGGGNYKGPKGK